MSNLIPPLRRACPDWHIGEHLVRLGRTDKSGKVLFVFMLLFTLLILPITKHLPADATALQAGQTQTTPSAHAQTDLSDPTNLEPDTRNLTPKYVLFLNQVRGSECCDPGSLEHLESQLDTFAKYNFPAAFAIRYDALTDPEFIELLKLTNRPTDQLTTELGLFLEITPSLAEASGVAYLPHESGQNLPPANELTTDNRLTDQPTTEAWYQAQNAYTVGYDLEDRKKLVDTAVAEFEKAFGQKPAFTTGWIMDTPTINYLREEHGIFIHQITREQWGTDSYTMDGGPVHYPYLASPNWAFLPSSLPEQGENSSEARERGASTLILRQTGSDPLFNYGDSTSAFTTQPNDYARDGKDIEYFKKLLNELLNQTHNEYGIAILGLENSMAQEYQLDYQRQIEYVSELFEKEQLTVISPTPFLQLFNERWANHPISVLQGDDVIHSSGAETIWVNASTYRLRFLKKDDEFILSDLRLYDPSWSDPYTAKNAQHLGFWVTPFLWNSSRYYLTKTQALPRTTQLKDWVKGKILPEFIYQDLSTQASMNDTKIQPIGLLFPPPTSEIQLSNHSDQSVQLSYTAETDQQYTLTFHPDHIQVEGEGITQRLNLRLNEERLPFITTKKENTRTSVQWETKQDDGSYVALNLSIDCAVENICTLTPQVNPTLQIEQLREEFYPYLYPEISDRPLDSEKTIFYAHNQHAVAGKNPVRFVFIPKDEYGYTVSNLTDVKLSSSPEIGEFIIQNQEGNTGVVFIDGVDNRVGKYEVTASIGEDLTKTQTIYFAPNCKENIGTCLTTPWQGWWYVQSIMQTRLRNM